MAQDFRKINEGIGAACDRFTVSAQRIAKVLDDDRHRHLVASMERFASACKEVSQR